MRLRTDKPAPLMALDRLEIPLQTNGSGRDICLPVIKCKISGGTRSLDGHACHDAYLELMRTAARLGISFWGSLGDWLSIPGQRNAQYLPDLSAVAAGPHEPRTFLLRRRSVERLGGHRHRGMTTAE